MNIEISKYRREQEKENYCQNEGNSQCYPEAESPQKVWKSEEHRKCGDHIPESIIRMIGYFRYWCAFQIHPYHCEDGDERKGSDNCADSIIAFCDFRNQDDHPGGENVFCDEVVHRLLFPSGNILDP